MTTTNQHPATPRRADALGVGEAPSPGGPTVIRSSRQQRRGSPPSSSRRIWLSGRSASSPPWTPTGRTSRMGPDLQRMLNEGWAAYAAREDPTAYTPPPPTLEVRKLSGYMPVSCCQMTDATGENHCEHPPPPQPSRRQRFRWAAQRWWSGLRMRLGAWIAGVDPDEWDD